MLEYPRIKVFDVYAYEYYCIIYICVYYTIKVLEKKVAKTDQKHSLWERKNWKVIEKNNRKYDRLEFEYCNTKITKSENKNYLLNINE